MTTTKILKSLLIAALLVSASTHAADQFKIGDSNCTLVDGQIRCTWNAK